MIGGWLTDNISWRWVFYINLPIGLLAFAGIMTFVTERRAAGAPGSTGSASARSASPSARCSSSSIAASSSTGSPPARSSIEAIIAASAFYLFLVHTFTTPATAFVNPRLFLDRNFSVSMFFIFIIGVTYLASLALMTPYLQTLMGYPVITAGIVMGPRGLGTMPRMFIVGRLIGKVDTRWLLVIGLGLTAWAMYDMTGWTPDVSQWTSSRSASCRVPASASCSCR